MGLVRAYTRRKPKCGYSRVRSHSRRSHCLVGLPFRKEYINDRLSEISIKSLTNPDKIIYEINKLFELKNIPYKFVQIETLGNYDFLLVKAKRKDSVVVIPTLEHIYEKYNIKKKEIVKLSDNC